MSEREKPKYIKIPRTKQGHIKYVQLWAKRFENQRRRKPTTNDFMDRLEELPHEDEVDKK